MRTRRFSLWEMIVAAVMIAILAMVFWTLKGIPARRGQLRDASCVSNLYQIGHGVLMYAHDHDGYLPQANHLPSRDGGPSLRDAIGSYSPPASYYRCPSDRYGWYEREGTSYNYGFGLLDVGQPPQPARSPCGVAPVYFAMADDFGQDWHRYGRMRLFADGHVKPAIRAGQWTHELREP